ncbi:hypothetical protein [Neobacillus vireti]|uniref:hypothetical protein n=1 Tax=Neobacillus vireti TaxID=220686 RepID=UPI002FFD9FCD
MKQVFRFDNKGYYVEPVILKDNDVIPPNCTDIEPTGSYFRGKFENGRWIEGATQKEIDDLKNTPIPKSPLEILQETVDQLVLDNLMRGF